MSIYCLVCLVTVMTGVYKVENFPPLGGTDIKQLGKKVKRGRKLGRREGKRGGKGRSLGDMEG